MASILFIVIIIAVSIYKEFIYFASGHYLLWIYFLVLSLPPGDALPYRSNLMIALLVAMVLFYLTCDSEMQIPVINVIGMGSGNFCCILYFLLAVVDQVAYDLQKGGYNASEKPVVFIGSYELNPTILESVPWVPTHRDIR